jgi:hypothetical protein
MNPLFSNQPKTRYGQNHCTIPESFGIAPAIIADTIQFKAVAKNKKLLRYISFCLLLLSSLSFVNGQGVLKKAKVGISDNSPKSLGWEGSEIIPASEFFNKNNWTCNFDHNYSDTCYVTTDDTCVYLHWKFAKGARFKYAQCYQVLNPSISLSGKDVFSIDIKGSSCGVNNNIRLKFEDGKHRPEFTWKGLASLTRWCKRLGVLKTQFDARDSMNWQGVTTVSIDVNNSSMNEVSDEEGVVAFRKLQADSVALWQRALSFETIKDSSLLTTVVDTTLNTILKRQNATGLFSTWLNDQTSELYGQGLVLKILATAGKWNNAKPSDLNALAAEKLALFLVKSQNQYGYWPKKWNSQGIAIDSTLWMPSFPWVITGLQNYYNMSGDIRVKVAIDKAKSFLYSLINVDTLYTIDLKLKKSIITDGRAYAAVIQSLFELGDSTRAKSLLQYIDQKLWDTGSKYWRESFESPRIVLFGNTWLSLLEEKWGNNNNKAQPLDALSVVSKALYTVGPGAPGGFDDYGPFATYYEATLSYICAGGPGSNALFYDLINYRLSDHSLPYYNDDISNIGGIWAVNWSNLVATAWLYFAASKSSPFDIVKPLKAPFEEPKKVFMIYRGWYNYSPVINDTSGWCNKDFYPLIGRYDSRSWALLTYHMLLSWSCGIDGLILNMKDDYDRQSLNVLIHTIKNINAIDSIDFKYKFALMYDDQYFDKTPPLTITTSKFKDLRDVIFPSTKNYLNYYGKPAVFVFHYDTNPLLSASAYKNTMNSVFGSNSPMLLWTSMGNSEKRPKDIDAYFPWIQLGDTSYKWNGVNWGKPYLKYFYDRVNEINNDSSKLSFTCGAVWPGYDDRHNNCIQEHNHWIDRNRNMYDSTWLLATKYVGQLPLKWMMIEEWNNWNDGTQIEPSNEYRYRYLQSTIRYVNEFKGANLSHDTCKFETAREIYKFAYLIEHHQKDSAKYYSMFQKAIRYFLENDCESAMEVAKTVTEVKTVPETMPDIEVYPNPASKLLYIKFKSNKPARIEISNINGQVILVKQLQDPDESIDISRFARGIYFLKVITGNHLEAHKVIFQ